MKWDDQGLVLALKPFTERKVLIQLFTEQKGVVNAIMSKTKNLAANVGDWVNIYASARLEQHMPTVKIELKKAFFYLTLGNQHKSLMLQSLTQILKTFLPQSHAYPKLIGTILECLESLQQNDFCLKNYCLFEKRFLQEFGFGLDLHACAVTGVKENLAYVSPKTGRAVSAEGAGPYIDKLLVLPAFFLDESLEPKNKCILQALELTGYFIDYFVTDNYHFLPNSRIVLLKKYQENYIYKKVG